MESITITATPELLTLLSVALACAAAAIVLTVKLISYLNLKKKLTTKEIEKIDLSKENQYRTAQYAKELLEFVRTVVAQIGAIRYQEFLDTKNLEKINREIVKTLIQDICKEVNESIQWDNITIDGTYLKKGFYAKQSGGNFIEILIFPFQTDVL